LSLAHFIERHHSLHRTALALWKHFPPRLAGFLRGILTTRWAVGAVAVIIDEDPADAQPPNVSNESAPLHMPRGRRTSRSRKTTATRSSRESSSTRTQKETRVPRARKRRTPPPESGD